MGVINRMNLCSHMDHIKLVRLPESVDGCEECIASGQSWVHLRICLECGHVGCSEDSPGAHAKQHTGSERTSDHSFSRARGGMGLVLFGRDRDAGTSSHGQECHSTLSLRREATCRLMTHDHQGELRNGDRALCGMTGADRPTNNSVNTPSHSTF